MDDNIKVGSKVFAVTEEGVSEVAVIGLRSMLFLGSLTTGDEEASFSDISEKGVRKEWTLAIEAQSASGEIIYEEFPRMSPEKDRWKLFFNREEAEEAMRILNPDWQEGDEVITPQDDFARYAREDAAQKAAEDLARLMRRSS